MSSSICVAILALFIALTFGHSQMRCANFDKTSGKCLAPIRNAGVVFEEENYEQTLSNGACQAHWKNPITSYYGNGQHCPDYNKCPDAMGSIQQGQNFTIMWVARNHAEKDQNPGSVMLYMSPVEDANQDVDTNTAVFKINKICEAPYMSCNGLNGDLVQCYATCKMPAAATGIHTLWWYWVQNSSGKTYTTCADIYVTAPSGSSIPSSPPVNTPAPISPPVNTPTPSVPAATPTPVATPVTTSSTPAKPSTSASIQTPTSNTGMAPASTTGASAAPVASTSAATPVTTPVNTPSSTPLTGTGCTYGVRACLGDNQYQTCTNSESSTYWAKPQTCQPGLKCKPSALFPGTIYCQ